MEPNTDLPPTIPENQNKSKFRLTVEPVGFLYVCAIIVQSVVVQNLYINKTCVVNFNLSSSSCESHNQTTEEADSDSIQRHVTTLNVYGSLIENIPSVVFVLFLGPWSDKHGRKIPMIFPVIGHILSVLLYIANFWFASWPAEYLLLASVPVGLCGGAAALFMSLNSYIADISTSENRTSRISLLYGFITVSYPTAMFSSIYIYTYGGYLAIWGTSLLLAGCALLYLIIVPDSRGKNRPNQEDQPNKIIEATEVPYLVLEQEESVLKNIWKSIKVTFQKRPGYKRASISILLASMSLFVFSQLPGTVSYLYVRKKFSWDEPEYALYATILSIIAVFGSVILLPLLSSYFKVHDCVVGVAAILGNISSFLVFAFADTPKMMYAGSVGLVLTTAIGVVIRSMISKQVESDELSQVYSVLASFESIVPLMSSPTFNLIYKDTLDSFPGCVYLVQSGLFGILVLLLLIVFLLQWKEKRIFRAYDTVIETASVVEVF